MLKSKYKSYVQKKNMSHVPFENKRSRKEKHMQNEKDMKKDKNRNIQHVWGKFKSRCAMC